jgi:hypothetical protein
MFEPMDVVSFGLFAPGLALLCIVLGQGRLLWWTEARWLGLCLAGAVALLSAATLVELHRKRPLIDVRWLSSGDMARFAIAIVLFRIVLSEQSTGVVGLLQILGLIPDQLLPLYWIILVATVAGFVTAALTVNPERVLTPLMISLVLIAAGSFLDARSTSLVRPVNFFLTQGMTAFAAALFLPPAMLFGVSRAFARGPYHLVGFATVFGAGQTLGGLAGSALVGSFVTVRERFHFNTIADHLVLSDPQVAARVRQLAGVYGRVLTDRVQLGAEGVQLLLQRATREAYVRAYDDAFVLLGAMATLVLLWFVALRTRRILQERRAAREQPA